MQIPWQQYHGHEGTRTSHIILALGVPFALFLLILSVYAPANSGIFHTAAVLVILASLLMAFRHSGVSVETTQYGITLTYLTNKTYIPWMYYKKIMLLTLHTTSLTRDTSDLTEEEYEGYLDPTKIHAAFIVLRNGTRHEIPVLTVEALNLIEDSYVAYISLSKA